MENEISNPIVPEDIKKGMESPTDAVNTDAPILQDEGNTTNNHRPETDNDNVVTDVTEGMENIDLNNDSNETKETSDNQIPNNSEENNENSNTNNEITNETVENEVKEDTNETTNETDVNHNDEVANETVESEIKENTTNEVTNEIVDNEVKEDINNEITNETAENENKEDVTNEVTNETVDNEVKEEINNEITNETVENENKEDVTNEVTNETVENENKEDVTNEVTNETVENENKEDITNEVINENVENEIKEDISNEVTNENVENEVKEDIINEVAETVENEVKEDIKPAVAEIPTINIEDMTDNEGVTAKNPDDKIDSSADSPAIMNDSSNPTSPVSPSKVEPINTEIVQEQNINPSLNSAASAASEALSNAWTSVSNYLWSWFEQPPEGQPGEQVKKEETSTTNANANNQTETSTGYAGFFGSFFSRPAADESNTNTLTIQKKTSTSSLSSSRLNLLSQQARMPSIQFVGREENDDNVKPIVNRELTDYIRPHLPLYQRESVKWVLRYSTAQHGISLNTLYQKVEGAGPLLLAIRDTDNNIFGAYVSEAFHVRKGFYGTREW